MAKKKSPPARTSKVTIETRKGRGRNALPARKASPSEREAGEKIDNSFGEAIGYGGAAGGGYFPQNQGTTFSTQLSNVTTIFKNLRYYFISNFRQILSQAYVEIGLIQTLCQVPVDDALRGGIEIQSSQLSPEEIKELQISIDRDKDLIHVGQAAIWNRLFGGAGIIIWVSDQDPETPLNMDSISDKTRLEFIPVDMWELTWSEQNVDQDVFDELDIDEDDRFYNYYGHKVHRSRVMPLKGLEAPSFLRPRLRGWGFSIVEKLVRSINQYLKATDLSFEVLDEFKLDIYKLKNLATTLMTPDGSSKVASRVAMTNWQKNYQNALVLDSEDEFDHKQLSFAGLAETMEGIRIQVASDMRFPLTKLFGLSAQGFNSGEDDIENYNAMVESEVRGKIKHPILRMLEIKCQKMFGFVPDDLMISFAPLRVLSSEQQETVKTQQFTRLLQALERGAITLKEFHDASNKYNLLGIQVDPDAIEAYEGAEGSSPASDDGDKTDEIEEEGDPKRLDIRRDPEPRTVNHDFDDDIFEPVVLPRPYRRRQWLKRSFINSLEFDKKAYEADGGDAWIDPRRQHFFEEPFGVDMQLWEKARDASRRAFGRYKWQFVLWLYRKWGGRFNEERKI